jgi:hypothetical protein
MGAIAPGGISPAGLADIQERYIPYCGKTVKMNLHYLWICTIIQSIKHHIVKHTAAKREPNGGSDDA